MMKQSKYEIWCGLEDALYSVLKDGERVVSCDSAEEAEQLLKKLIEYDAETSEVSYTSIDSIIK